MSVQIVYSLVGDLHVYIVISKPSKEVEIEFSGEILLLIFDARVVLNQRTQLNV